MGVPAPEPVFLEAGVSELGGPFFAMAQAPGRNPGDVFGAAHAIPREVGLQLARFLASLHALDCGAVPQYPAGSMANRALVRLELETSRQRLIDAAGHLPPTAGGLYDWLLANLPPDPPRPVIVHGDVGFHNLLIQDGSLTVVLDWERAHPGEAAEDLAYLRPSLAGVLDFDDFLEAYAAAGGARPDPATLRFYTVWQDLWRYVACQALLAVYARTPRLSSLFAGRIFGPRFLGDAVRNSRS
jgi:aminoglycoside phosphotransferase (APT) family kinase protein